jgi:hypothetical protein
VYTLTLTASIVMLSGCSGGPSVPASASPNAMGRSIAIRPNAGKSWMSPEAKKARNLLYIADHGEFQVVVYAWPNPKGPIGTLAGDQFTYPAGECADNAGHLYITDSGSNSIIEYKSGATVPLRILSDSGVAPQACSVDRTSGDLAVANFGTADGGGSVSIYHGGKGTPKIYTDSSLYNVAFLSYDNEGVLWLDGQPSEGGFLYASLNPNTGKFENKPLQGATLGGPGGVEFDGKHITVADAANPILYQTEQFKVVGNTTLSYTPVQYWLQNGVLIGPDDGYADVSLYHYPNGGKPFTTLSGDLGTPFGAAVTTMSH